MQYPIEIKPPRPNYLLSHLGFMLIAFLLTSVVSIGLFRDHLNGFVAIRGAAIGFLLGGLLLWGYDEITKFKRFTVIVTESHIEIPFLRHGKIILSQDRVDKPRTLAYNSGQNLVNRIRYTLWFSNGDRTSLSKLFFSPSQINSILEGLGLR